MSTNHEVSLSLFREGLFLNATNVKYGKGNFEIEAFNMLKEHNIIDNNYEIRAYIYGEKHRKSHGVIIKGSDIESDLLDNVITNAVNKLIKEIK